MIFTLPRFCLILFLKETGYFRSLSENKIFWGTGLEGGGLPSNNRISCVPYLHLMPLPCLQPVSMNRTVETFHYSSVDTNYVFKEGKFKLRAHPQGYCDFLLMTKSMTPAGSGAAPAVSDGTGGGWLIAGARAGAGAGGSSGFWAFTSWSWD